ncbi:apolipoprotein L1 [Cynoglossus semilaevis]|nr:glutamic acid-rich protein-like [Cynoglossus semilaevis]
MDRYDNLELDLECDGGGVAQKAALFGGMFKRSSKIVEPQDNLSSNGDLSKSTESLTDNNKDKGVLKGMFKKTTKSTKETYPEATQSEQEPHVSSVDSSSVNKASKDNSGVLGGILKLPHKPGHVRRPSQDLLECELSATNGGLPENTSAKESAGMFSGMFKKSPKSFGARTQSQEDLTAPNELSGSNDNLSLTGNTKESAGKFSGMFKKSPKPFRARPQSQEDLTAQSEVSGSNDNLSAAGNTKESSGMFKVFKKHPKRAQSQDDLSAPDELSRSNDSLSETNTKEKGGILSGYFKRKVPKSYSQDNLFMDDELSASSENLTGKSSKGGVAAKLLKNPFSSSSSSQEKDKEGDSQENSSSTEKHKHKQSGFSAMMKSTFYADKPEKKADSEDEELVDREEQSGHKQNKLVGAMNKLNPFRSANKNDKILGSDEEDLPEKTSKSAAMPKLNPFRTGNKKDPEDTETPREKEQNMEEKPVKGTAVQQDKGEWKERSETPQPPPRPTKEEMKKTSAYNKVKTRGTEDPQSQSDDESAEVKGGDELRATESQPVKKHKDKPYRPRAPAKASSDDDELKDEEESLSQDEKKDEEEEEKKATKVKKPKKHNPFMPRVKAKVKQRSAQTEADNAEEAEGGNRSLFDRLEDLREPSRPETNTDDVEDLMEWWDTVEQWEDTPQEDDMTEKEEAKAFAVTADKVQKGIRVFNKLFSERAESLWQHVIDLNAIADGLDKFNKKTKIAQITGGSTSAIGGVATIAGLALAPITMGTSLIVTAVGLGVATAGGLTSAGAGISNQVNNSLDRKKVEKIVQDYQKQMVDLNKCLKFIKQGIENLRRFDLIKMKNHAYNNDFPVLSSRFYEDGAMAGKAILINANEIMRVVQIANVAGSTAARAVQIASMATGVLTGLFVGMDIYFVAKDSKELKKGAKSEFAAKIREVSMQLHDGLVELNSLREELQSTSSEDKDTADVDSEKKEKDNKYDSSEEDEIDRIKKAIKKDIENREYV